MVSWLSGQQAEVRKLFLESKVRVFSHLGRRDFGVHSCFVL
jgi:hypothetical protein